MRLFVVCLLCLATVRTQTIDELLLEVFGNQTTTQAPSVDPRPTPTVDPRPNPNITLTGCPSGSDCVPLYLCKDEKIITHGETLIDIRFDADAPQQCLSLEQCCSIGDKVNEPLIQPKEKPEGCGFRNIDGVGFKITGDKDQESQYGEFPWMVAILREEQAGNQIFNIYQCGASIISPGVVLTAAHCVDRKAPKTLRVRAGEWDTQTRAELLPDQDRNVVDVIVHPDYYRGALFNDIALLILDAPFEIAENVKPVCLPPATTDFKNLRCFATGWGKDTFGQAGKYHAILKKIDLPIVPNDICQTELRKTRLGNNFELHYSFLCAGGEAGKDTCKGDGGSPLVCPIPGSPERYYQAGIVAWGIGCGDPIPSVYANVAKLRPWIDEQLAYKRVNSAFYTP